jgi:hypothetical protein
MGRTIAHLRRGAAVEGLIAITPVLPTSLQCWCSTACARYIGIAPADEVVMDADAEVVALKLRTVPVRRW